MADDEQSAQARQPSRSPLLQPSHSRRARSASADTANSLMPPAGASSDRGLTASDLIAHQQLLEAQAREAIPFSYTRASCTHEKGHIRQPLWACKTCSRTELQGDFNVCAGCSIGCHADHELVELFAKRDSRCDCGTILGNEEEPNVQPCRLRPPSQKLITQTGSNMYGRNHQGHFCYCEKGYTYDPLEEEETMFQCLVCEDWFHEGCTSLTPQDADPESIMPEQRLPPLIAHESFDSFICDACVRHNPLLIHYIGKDQWGACLKLLPKKEGDAVASDGFEGPSKELFVEPMGKDAQRYLVVGLPANEKDLDEVMRARAAGAARVAAAGPDTSTSSLGIKRNLTPIVEGTADDAEEDDPEAGPSVKRVKVDEEADDGGHSTTAAPSEGVDTKPSHPSPRRPPDRSTPLERRSYECEKEDPRPRSPSCTLPPIPTVIRSILDVPLPVTEDGSVNDYNPGDWQSPDYRLDIFLSEGDEDEGDVAEAFSSTGSAIKGWRRRLCRCTTCVAQFKSRRELAGILEEEETYEPPSSPQLPASQPQSQRQSQGDRPGSLFAAAAAAGGSNSQGAAEDDDDAASSSSSSYDMAMSALSSLPRAQTLEALQGYSRLKDALYEHLRPFAREGRMVDEATITNFFEEWRRRERQGGGDG